VRNRFLVLCLAVACLVAPSAFAQDQVKPPQPAPGQKPATPPKPPVARAPLGLRAFVAVEGESLSASKTFKALTGSSTISAVGGGGEVLNLFKRVFIRVAVTSGSTNGERAVVIDGQLVSTGVPMTIGLRTFELVAGWRKPFATRPSPSAPPKSPARPRYAIYFGAGLLSTKLTETSDFAAPGDDEENSFTGYSVFGGLDAAIWNRIGASIEAQYRSVADALGDGGLSEVFNETNLGGVVIRGLISFRIK
jgi:opacity protein-like surface antigen